MLRNTSKFISQAKKCQLHFSSKPPIIETGESAYKAKRTMVYMIPMIIGGSVGILEPSIAFESTLSGFSIGVIGHSLIAENNTKFEENTDDIARPQ